MKQLTSQKMLQCEVQESNNWSLLIDVILEDGSRLTDVLIQEGHATKYSESAVAASPAQHAVPKSPTVGAPKAAPTTPPAANAAPKSSSVSPAAGKNAGRVVMLSDVSPNELSVSSEPLQVVLTDAASPHELTVQLLQGMEELQALQVIK